MQPLWCLALSFLSYAAVSKHAYAQEQPVTTGRALQIAVSDSARAVVITEHLDVRGMTAQGGAIFLLTEDISIRVRPAWCVACIDASWHAVLWGGPRVANADIPNVRMAFKTWKDDIHFNAT